MSEPLDINENRRGFLKRVGLGAAALPLVGLAACAKQEAPAPAAAPAEPAPAPAAAAPAPAEPAPAEAAPAEAAPAEQPAATSATDYSSWPRVDEAEPVALALGYKHDASKIDPAKQPRHKAGQVCRNCVQWKGTDTDEWGPCGIFPKKLVNANGWCTTYAAKA